MNDIEFEGIWVESDPQRGESVPEVEIEPGLEKASDMWQLLMPDRLELGDADRAAVVAELLEEIDLDLPGPEKSP